MRRRKKVVRISKGRLWRDNRSDLLKHREEGREIELNTGWLDSNCQLENYLRTPVIKMTNTTLFEELRSLVSIICSFLGFFEPFCRSSIQIDMSLWTLTHSITVEVPALFCHLCYILSPQPSDQFSNKYTDTNLFLLVIFSTCLVPAR